MPRALAALVGEPSHSSSAARTRSGLIGVGLCMATTVATQKHLSTPNLQLGALIFRFATGAATVVASMTEMAEQMAALLRFANYSKIGAELGVGRAAVQKWAKGKNVGAYQLRQVRELFAVTVGPVLDEPDTQKEAAPHIEGRLDEIEILVRAIASVSGVDLQRVEAMRRELLAELREQQLGAASRTGGPRDRDR